MGVVAETRAIVVGRRVIMEIRKACFQGSTSASGDLRPSLSAYALEQIIKLYEVIGVRRILPMFALFNVLHRDIRTRHRRSLFIKCVTIRTFWKSSNFMRQHSQ